MTAYRRMMKISWTEHRTNQSILDELFSSHRFLTHAVSLSTLAMLSELKTSLQIYYMVASMVPDLEADQNDVGQTM